MTEEKTETPVIEVRGTRGLLAATMEAHTKSAPERGEMFARNTVSVTILSDWCPETFDEHFKLTLAEATPDIEAGAAKSAAGEPAAMAFELAKMSMVQVNGDKIPSSIERDWLWSAIGQKGRQAVSLQYMKAFSANGVEIEAALGNPEYGTL